MSGPFCNCMSAEIVSKDAFIFAISLCTSDWQLHMSSKRGGRWGEVANEQHPCKFRGWTVTVVDELVSTCCNVCGACCGGVNCCGVG
jgi:hypothetical protein